MFNSTVSAATKVNMKEQLSESIKWSPQTVYIVFTNNQFPMWMPDVRIETIKYIQENIDYTFPYIRLRDVFGNFKSK